MRRYLLYGLVVVLLTIFWIGLEYILDGQIISQRSDTVILWILSWFIMDWIDHYMFER